MIDALDDWGAWWAAVAAGLAGVLWIGRKLYHAVRSTVRRFKSVGRKIDALEALAVRELSGEDGSTKDYARLAAGQAMALEELEHRVTELETWRVAHDRWSARVAAKIHPV